MLLDGPAFAVLSVRQKWLTLAAIVAVVTMGLAAAYLLLEPGGAGSPQPAAKDPTNAAPASASAAAKGEASDVPASRPALLQPAPQKTAQRVHNSADLLDPQTVLPQSFENFAVKGRYKENKFTLPADKDPRVVHGEGSGASGTAAVQDSPVPVAQEQLTLRAGLIQRDPKEPAFPKITAGRVVWTVSGSDTEPKTIRGTGKVTFPDFGDVRIEFHLSGELVRNAVVVTIQHREKSTLAPVSGIDSIEMRQNNQDRGLPIRGTLAQDRPGQWQLVLGGSREDFEQNRQLILSNDWINVVFVMGDRTRRTLTVERGTLVSDALHAASRL